MIFDRDTHQPDPKPATPTVSVHKAFWYACGGLILGLVVGSITGAIF